LFGEPTKHVITTKHVIGPDLICTRRGCSQTWASERGNQTECLGVRGTRRNNLKATPAEEQEIFRLRKSGKTLMSIAEQFGISRTLVTSSIKRAQGLTAR